MDAVFSATLQEKCVPQEDQHGFGLLAGEHNICFYANYRRIARQDPIWVQVTLTTMVRMFERVGLQTNLDKTKAVIFTPEFIWGQQGAEAYKRRSTGEGTTFQERKRTRVSCEVCGRTMSASSLRCCKERKHGRVLPQVRGLDVGRGGLDVYRVWFPLILKLVDCPVEGCLAKAKK